MAWPEFVAEAAAFGAWAGRALATAGDGTMATACPVCGTSLGRHAQCPSCAGGGFRAPNRSGAIGLQRRRWQETAWGRVLIGLMLSQGLFHGFQQLFTGILLAFDHDGGVNQTVTNPVGFVSLQVLGM